MWYCITLFYSSFLIFCLETCFSRITKLQFFSFSRACAVIGRQWRRSCHAFAFTILLRSRLEILPHVHRTQWSAVCVAIEKCWPGYMYTIERDKIQRKIKNTHKNACMGYSAAAHKLIVYRHNGCCTTCRFQWVKYPVCRRTLQRVSTSWRNRYFSIRTAMANE